MSKLVLVLAVVLVLTLVAAVAWLTFAIPRYMVTGQAASREILAQKNLECPGEAVEASRPWGKAGWMVFCEHDGTLHGPWVAAEGGRLALRGEYSEGQRSGLWEWYDEEGNVVKHTTYGKFGE